jgi:hypothetical protein
VTWYMCRHLLVDLLLVFANLILMHLILYRPRLLQERLVNLNNLNGIELVLVRLALLLNMDNSFQVMILCRHLLLMNLEFDMILCRHLLLALLLMNLEFDMILCRHLLVDLLLDGLLNEHLHNLIQERLVDLNHLKGTELVLVRLAILLNMDKSFQVMMAFLVDLLLVILEFDMKKTLKSSKQTSKRSTRLW